MTLTITEKEIKENKEKYPGRKVKDRTFNEQVEIDKVDGLDMIDCTFKFDKEGEAMLHLNKCENIRLTKCHFTKKEKKGEVVFLENCEKVTLKDCDFQGKSDKGNFIDIKGNDSLDNHIEGCTFKNHSFGGKNGGEAILIGRGENGGRKSFKTVVTGCTFTKCNGDVELISIKQSDNEIVNNTFEDWEKGNVSIRYGNSNTIKKNTFRGSGGGIVVRGKENKILDNTHIGNNNQEHQLDYRPLTVECGSSDGEYAQAIDNTIADNTFKNCRGPCIVLGQENRPRKPEDNTFKNNTLIAEDVDSTFLIIPDHVGDDKDKKKLRDANNYKDNILKGRRASKGILEDSAFK